MQNLGAAVSVFNCLPCYLIIPTLCRADNIDRPHGARSNLGFLQRRFTMSEAVESTRHRMGLLVQAILDQLNDDHNILEDLAYKLTISLRVVCTITRILLQRLKELMTLPVYSLLKSHF
ncbi:hypothetical protein BRADI_3g30236v3 [Brachypodium distachyon]|uniref:Uncharacterized protein n=1 Tax=Brachypodium distachyon TaxID=15368 RepID=A0A0Q3JGH0_BRADI|nr:hypothetical protein BRADI_3g30236v3 [Brachypodium distachyon]PNT67657.1 hypothetical protein BRADI_3g30236v3 [Brachypodium distachyon]PNT67659.1 hypothetical protein BRADI_3g30236v3 [Brachypodium distachyon]